MDIFSGIMGMGGLLIALLSIYWNHKEKIEPFKKQLYERQTEGTSACVGR